MRRRKTRTVFLGNLPVGSGHPISIQSMTKTDTRDAVATVNQIKRLEKVRCEVVRVAVPDTEAADALKVIKHRVSIPLVADIHFNYRLALKAIKQGVDGLRINPGNIGARSNVEKVVKAAADAGIPIRIGVNSGS
ncbi:MAG: flavodoxin-dependent (E)-4-hydroxy-3-methylbut-2-enyl-diphosphate synthase, partial [Candidatus Abyssubacteria bacterium]|nr:flavodoxin-dependent (E)-4-hydroxy-3-methylbut-2-enyl-diphosphate synthase [Candidatus Abyssubacteria bacterium]